MNVRGKRVLVVGLAKSGRAAALCLRRQGAVVTVTDAKPPAQFREVIPELLRQKIGLELGCHRTETFLRQDMVVVSPGVRSELPHLLAAGQAGIPIYPEIEAASWFLSSRLVGITGTNGKSTTTALLGQMLEASGFASFVGGNIGVPLMSAVDRVSAESILVVELSSYQLEAIHEFRPHVAVLLNITSHHVDRHRDFERYVQAKARIFCNQRANDFAILNADDPAVMGLAPQIASRKILFSRGQDLPEGVLASGGRVCYRVGNLERVLLETKDLSLRGDFNLENVMAAAAAACVLGADFDALRRAVKEFQGLPHRLELVGEIRGVGFYDDSKATSVDATAKAVLAFERGVHLIVGGKDEGASFQPLRDDLERRVRQVYLIGEAAERIGKELEGSAPLIRAGDLETAMRTAFGAADPGDIVLLAPACPSFDQFENFEHRGRVFKEIVERLAREAKLRETGVASRESELGKLSQDSSSPGSSLEPPTSNPESPALSRESPITIPESAPSSESSTPKPEPIYMYEVETEEATALDMDLPAETVEGRRESVEQEPLRPLEELDDEAALFEVRMQAGEQPRKTEGEPSSGQAVSAAERGGLSEAAKDSARDSQGEEPGSGPKRQPRLPGM